MKVIGNLKILDGEHPPCWILEFEVYSLSYEESNAEENTSNLVILATNEGKLLAI